MTKTIKHRLDEACSERGLSWRGRPDQPLYGPRPYTEWWTCAYHPASGHVAAFFTGLSGWRSAKLALLGAVEGGGAPPEVVDRREGTILEWDGSEWLLVGFADGTTEPVRRPWLNLGWQPGNDLALLRLVTDPEPLLLWGPEHMPSRPAETLIPPLPQ